MYTKQEIIIKSYREGQSQRSISRELQISRKTVKKYIEGYEFHLQANPSQAGLLSGYLCEPPIYKGRAHSRFKLSNEIQEAIDKFLEQNAEKKRNGLRKQLLKKCDIHELLNAQGFNIGYTTVCNYIGSKLSARKTKEAFIRQQYQPGESCEFDWGEIKIYINGELTRFQMAIFTAGYSNYRYAAIYQRQDTLAFMEAHAAFFEFTKGAYHQMTYDNMRVAVAKFVGPKETLSPQQLYEAYKQRDEIEVMFDSYKNFLDADKTYMQDRHVLEGWLMANFIVMIAYYKLFTRLKKQDCLANIPQEILSNCPNQYTK